MDDTVVSTSVPSVKVLVVNWRKNINLDLRDWFSTKKMIRSNKRGKTEDAETNWIRLSESNEFRPDRLRRLSDRVQRSVPIDTATKSQSASSDQNEKQTYGEFHWSAVKRRWAKSKLGDAGMGRTCNKREINETSYGISRKHDEISSHLFGKMEYIEWRINEGLWHSVRWKITSESSTLKIDIPSV